MDVVEIYVLHCRKFGKAEKHRDKNLSDPTRHLSEIKTMTKLVFLIVSCVTLNSLINMGFMFVFGMQLGFNLLYNRLTCCLSPIGGISLQCLKQ